MAIVNLTALRDSHPRLYRTTTKTLGIEGATGEREIDFFDLDQFTRGELFEWQTNHEFNLRKQRFEEDAAKNIAATQAAAEARRAEAVAAVEEPAEPQIDMNELVRERQRDIEARAAETARVAPVVPPPPAPQQQPVEVLGTLPSGEPQLPLDADVYVMRRASTKQLLDLNKRRREATGTTVIGAGKSQGRVALRF